MNITIFIHIYYDDTALSLYKKIKPLLSSLTVSQIIINLPAEHPRLVQVTKIIENKLPKAIQIKTSNKGKDIGGKLAMLHFYLANKLNSDLLLFIHDKKSPQTVIGDEWSKQLYTILDSKKANEAISIFNSVDKVGMIGNRSMIFNKSNKSKEELFAGNEKIIYEISKKYNLTSENLEFIGGTMFWVKDKIFRSFFEKYCPLKIRSSLEEGNVLDDLGPTNTHSWERLFGWIVSSQGYKILGV